jgi:hypothetical protein
VGVRCKGYCPLFFLIQRYTALLHAREKKEEARSSFSLLASHMPFLATEAAT